MLRLLLQLLLLIVQHVFHDSWRMSGRHLGVPSHQCLLDLLQQELPLLFAWFPTLKSWGGIVRLP